MMRKGFWGRFAERAASSPYLVLLVATSILLSIASFYTTYDGLSDFLEHAVLAAFVTSAIQSLLFVTSWRLGFMAADKEPIAWIDIGVFAVCFVLSVAFSFASLFDVVFSKPQQELASLTRVHNGVSEAVTSVGLKTKERRQDLVEELLDSTEYEAWRRNVLAIADVAAEAKGILTEVFAQSYERRRERAERLATEAQQTAAAQATLEREVAEDGAALARTEAQRSPLVEEIAQLRQRLTSEETAVVEQQHLMDAEERGVGDTGRSGRGPVWIQLAREQQRRIATRDASANLLALKEQQLEKLDGERAELLRRIEGKNERLSGVSSRISSAQRDAAQANRDLDTVGTETGFDLDESVETLRAYLPEFARTLDLKPFNDAAALCTRMLTEMNAIEVLQPKLSGLGCDRGSMLTSLNRINEAAGAIANLARDCLSGGANARRVDDLSFDEALSYGRGCLDLSGLPNDAIRGERREMDRLEREESPLASPFTKTTNALLAGEKLAVFALFIAVSIDLLVLFSGLIGAKSIEGAVEAPVAPIAPTDTPRERTYKYVLSYARPQQAKIGGVRYEHRIRPDDIENAEVRREVERFLDGNPKYVVLDTSKAEYHLRHGFVENVRRLLQEELDGQAAERERLAREAERARNARRRDPGGKRIETTGPDSDWETEDEHGGAHPGFVGLTPDERLYEENRRQAGAAADRASAQARRGSIAAAAADSAGRPSRPTPGEAVEVAPSAPLRRPPPDRDRAKEAEPKARRKPVPPSEPESEDFDDLDNLFEPTRPQGGSD